jgi:hypothetical protein
VNSAEMAGHVVESGGSSARSGGVEQKNGGRGAEPGGPQARGESWFRAHDESQVGAC